MNVHLSVLETMRSALAGKTIGRTYFNATVRSRCTDLKGHVLDIAGGAKPSYLPFLPKDIDLVRTDRVASLGVIVVDMNQQLPFPDASFDAVLVFSALYILEDPDAFAAEVYRVLKPGGTWYIASPFIANEMPEPHDYGRFTAEGLDRLCMRAGFKEVEIFRMGERVSAAVQLLHPFFAFNIVRMFVFPLALLGDKFVPRSVRSAHPTPIGYFVRATK